MSDKDLDYLLNLKDDEFSSVTRSPFYFGPHNKKLLGWLHRVTSSDQLDTCVVICPPLAVEYMSTYRSMRYLADYFALMGIPALRFDYHGTGDSSGLNDEGNRLEDWLWSIEQAYEQVKQLTGCSKVGFVGLRMGGTLASLVSQKLDLDFLVVWAALENGRRFIRETRAIQMTGISQTKGEASDLIEAGGMVYWPETADAIAKINLTEISPKASRILIIPRDDLQVNNKLKSVWEGQGRFVEQVEMPGSSSMLLVALESIVPHESLVNIVKWVKAGASEGGVTNYGVESTLNTSVLIEGQGGSEVKESVLWFGPDNGYFSILTEPLQKDDRRLPVVVIANSGATHRVGVSRLYTTLARELACLGFCSLRIDIPGLGDSIIYDREKENHDYIDHSSEVIGQLLKAFDSKFGSNKYIITGLCSGAYFSFHAALDLDEANIVESLLMNPLTFYWHKGMEIEDSPIKNFGNWNWYMQAIRDPKSWKKLICGGVDYKALIKTVKNRLRIVVTAKIDSDRLKATDESKSHYTSFNNLSSDLMKIASRDRHLSLVLASCDPGYDILMTSAGKTARRLMQEGRVDVHMIEDADHTFSKYRPRCQAINVIIEHLVTRYAQD